MNREDKKILLMGVSGTGKSLIGRLIADALGVLFIDGDDFHTENNLNKMNSGIPLDDNDREGWLKTLNNEFVRHSNLILACSALKPEYRNMLRENNQDLIIVYLKGSFDIILSRHKKRQGHFFNGEKMLRNQFDTLVEPSPDEAIFIEVDQGVEHILEQALAEINKCSSPS
ncbi:MAG: gluconokinase [Marinomonas sp.]|uniref:gluconokinase n=1 Tax=unclassified Marinomonas TaxID=196814 RepID=UPI0007AF7CC6|nr:MULTISPECIES: gluconokinase [unclassified Marinomonas]KZM44219.1 gluconate kinase [Marinomonas sp. SBI22]KZM45378.1 gluconate kinase [Marinomonas sp. SBI8L]